MDASVHLLLVLLRLDSPKSCSSKWLIVTCPLNVTWLVTGRESAVCVELEDPNPYDEDFALKPYLMNFLAVNIHLENLSHVNVQLKKGPLIVKSGIPCAKLRLIWGLQGQC